jgi:hypothetical protein
MLSWSACGSALTWPRLSCWQPGTGDFSPESDADVAVLLHGKPGRLVPTKLDMSDIAYDILLDTGINVSPLPVWLDEWEHPETYSNPHLLANISREGIRL